MFILANITNALCGQAILGTAVYAILGVVILMAAYKVFDIINPLDFDKEIANNNIALGIMMC